MALKPIHKQILDVMYYERRYMSVREIASLTESSWQTIEKYIKGLVSRKFVKKKIYPIKDEPKKKKIKYEFNYEYYRKMLTKKKGGIQ